MGAEERSGKGKGGEALAVGCRREERRRWHRGRTNLNDEGTASALEAHRHDLIRIPTIPTKIVHLRSNAIGSPHRPPPRPHLHPGM